MNKIILSHEGLSYLQFEMFSSISEASQPLGTVILHGYDNQKCLPVTNVSLGKVTLPESLPLRDMAPHDTSVLIFSGLPGLQFT